MNNGNENEAVRKPIGNLSKKELYGLRPVSYKALAVLVNESDDNGFVEYKSKDLCAVVGVTYKTLQIALSDLLVSGYISEHTIGNSQRKRYKILV